ncbi:MAG: MotA/TolQ/ExbB proton channel family protein [Flavobacteriales bacterium]
MKKLFALITFAAVLNFSYAPAVFALEGDGDTTEVVDGTEATGEEMTTKAEEVADAAPAAPEAEESAEVEEAPATFHQTLKKYFIDGGAGFMGIVLVVLIIGLALCIERIIYLSLATGNSDKLLNEIESGLGSGGVDAAKEVCRNTKGPVASIFYQGLNRKDEGLDMVEKSIVSYGSVQMGMLEKGLSWISLCIALAPMLGFMGTVIGMIGAFDAIEAAGDISPSLVAGGIKVALLTTVFGLIVAIILQVFYNYLIAKVDSLVNDMEESSISFMDILIKSGK